jgi:hypothetical protein
MTFRIFCNDRSKTLYSALNGVQAANALRAVEIAKAKWPPIEQSWGVERYKAIEWPPTAALSRAWLKKHVDAQD